MELLNINYYEALKVIKEYTNDYHVPIIEKRVHENNIIELPGRKLEQRHKDYLLKRNFDPDLLERKYKIRGTNHIDGLWKFRIIIPIYFKNQLVSFTSRAIYEDMEPRYLTLAKNKERICHKNILYNYDNCVKKHGKNSIILVEGLFDVMNLGDNTVCTFGTSVTSYQLQLLSEFDSIFIIFDPEEQAQKKALKLARNLAVLNKQVENLYIKDIEDPGAMTEEQVKELKEELGL
jgi:DNA primase